MLAFSNFFNESAEADINSVVQEFKQFGMMSLKNDVSEIYSRLRVTAYAQSLGLNPGFALDLAVIDPDDGKPWDFDITNKRIKALHKIRTETSFSNRLSDVYSFQPIAKLV